MLLAASTFVLAAVPLAAHADELPVSEMRWRILGPALPEGRATAVAGSDAHALIYYAGTAGGGAWKTTDGGASWQNISDDIHLASVGAIAVDPADDNVVWAGAGETNPRNDVIPESGLYRTRNSGRAWEKINFPADATGISRIILDPKDPKHVIVGVLGDPFGPSTARGVYVSFDGGTTFAKTLYLSEQSGVSDMVMSPSNPNVLYAGMWHVLRRPWTLTSGGTEDDGLYRSTDGGKTWTQVTGHGFPAAPIGRIGIAIAPSQPSRIYALVESHDGIVWRSDDDGATWSMVSKDTQADQRPFYFSHLRVSPTNPKTVYALSLLLATSFDGGQKFNLSAFGVHPDLHDMWMSADGERMALAGDGGIAISTNGGVTWANARNIPVGQVYRVAVSNTIPYIVCGGLQDNNAFCGPAFNGNADGITNRDWFKSIEGDGEWAIPDPTDARDIWSDYQDGEIQIYDRYSHDGRDIRPYRGTAEEDFVLAKSRYRFNWESPIAFAAYDPHVAFIGANVVFETTDRGLHWKQISPDLTRNDKSKQQVSKDTVTHDESGAENYSTILDIETSPLHNGEIWTGSDDGLVHVTLDGGKSWRDVTPAALPADSAVETVAVSTLSDGTAYISADRHAMGDRGAYIFLTHDFGGHWTKIVNGIPQGEYARAVRQDIHNGSIVYAGTNRGIDISCDGGATWRSFQNNLPAVEVRDIRFQPQFDDLVIATHGRAIWAMDDMRAVQLAGCGKPATPVVIGPRPVIELNAYRDDEGNYTDFVASQPGGGLLSGGTIAKLYYWLPKPAQHRPTIDVYDAKGQRVRHVEGEHDFYIGQESSTHWLSNADGKNEFLYDLTIDGPPRYNSAPFFFRGPEEGPQLPPGRYTMAFHLDGKTYRVPIVLMADPQSKTTQKEYELAFAQQRRLYDLLGRIDTMLNSLHDVREQLAATQKSLPATDADASAKIKTMLDSIDAEVATLTSSPESFEDNIQKQGQIREDVLNLISQETLAQASLQLYARLETQYRARAVAYNAWVQSLVALNASLQAAKAKTVALPSNAPTGPGTLVQIVSK
jgi:photosystem II stability/assembly factor-like uncharacterized protein